MKKGRGNPENLRPVRNKEEARERGRKGGKRSGEVRRARKSFADTLKAMLSCQIPPSSPLYKRTKKQLEAMGMHWTPTIQDIPTLGMIKKAEKDPKAFVAIRDTIGEKPVERIQDLTPPPKIVLGLMPEVKPKNPADEDEEGDGV